MPKGKHKGGKRHFTNFDEESKLKEKEEKEKAWRRARGGEDSDDEDGSDKSDKSDESSEESSSEEEEVARKPKGMEGIIEIENPNYVKQVTKKVSSLSTGEPTPGAGAAAAAPAGPRQLSRKEREEIDKQRADAHYRKLHSQGKTDEARADLERLALIRKQREEVQMKKDAEKKAKESAAAAKKDTIAKTLNKKGGKR